MAFRIEPPAIKLHELEWDAISEIEGDKKARPRCGNGPTKRASRRLP